MHLPEKYSPQRSFINDDAAPHQLSKLSRARYSLVQLVQLCNSHPAPLVNSVKQLFLCLPCDPTNEMWDPTNAGTGLFARLPRFRVREDLISGTTDRAKSIVKVMTGQVDGLKHHTARCVLKKPNAWLFAANLRPAKPSLPLPAAPEML